MSWLPGLVVLIVGLAGGLLLARAFKGSARRKTPATGRELRIADLEARRDELYTRLREINRGLAPAADRESLELAAARTLRDLDRLGGDLVEKEPRLAREEETEAPAEATPARAPARHFLTGFAYGAGLLILVGGLIYWAVRDAQPRQDTTAPMSAPAAGDPVHPDLSDLPPEAANRIASIIAHLERAPDDLDARKDLGYAYLGASRFVEGYRVAEEILARRPEDPDGLYMQGLVRLTMGQAQIAEELLNRALAADPDHVDSLTATGIISLQRGDYPTAIAIWKRGLAAIGGSNEMIERLIRLAEEGRPPEEILGMTPPPAEPPPAEARTEPAVAPEPQATAPDAITVSVGLAPGANPVPGSILYVILRGEGSGPPVAVKRIETPRFPMTLTLTQADSMMGAPIPETGQLTARLDVDGSVSTRDPGNLEAAAEVSLGEAVTLRLDTPG